MSDSYNPTSCSPPGSSVLGILQARILEWVAISFSRGSSWPRDWTQDSPSAGRCFTDWAMQEAPRQRNQGSNCQHPPGHRKSKRVPEKHLFLLYWLCQSLWLCGSQQTVENSKRDGNTRPPNCLLRNLYTGQEETVRTGLRTDWFQIGKGVRQGCILSPCLFNLYANCSHEIKTLTPWKESYDQPK